jgi:hypothetical protein
MIMHITKYNSMFLTEYEAYTTNSEQGSRNHIEPLHRTYIITLIIEQHKLNLFRKIHQILAAKNQSTAFY